MNKAVETPDARRLRKATEAFCRPDYRIAALSYFGTFAVYFLTLWLAVASWPMWPLTALLVVINAFAGVRLYVLQHDAGHHSLVALPRLNDLAGQVLSPFTLTPYRAMQYNHNAHHVHLGNLDHRETTEVYTMTVHEWARAGWMQRLFYRLYRNPFIMLPVGGLWTYLFAYRWPQNARRTGLRGLLLHNAAVLGWLAVIFLLGGATAALIFLATALTAGSIGVFLVYLQHNFEDAYWDRKPGLTFDRATLVGSSTLDFGWLFDLAVANISHHALHHFNPRIPSYRLRSAFLALRDDYGLRSVSFPSAVAALRLKLWDEEREMLVPFSAAARAPRTPDAAAGV